MKTIAGFTLPEASGQEGIETTSGILWTSRDPKTGKQAYRFKTLDDFNRLAPEIFVYGNPLFPHPPRIPFVEQIEEAPEPEAEVQPLGPVDAEGAGTAKGLDDDAILASAIQILESDASKRRIKDLAAAVGHDAPVVRRVLEASGKFTVNAQGWVNPVEPA